MPPRYMFIVRLAHFIEPQTMCRNIGREFSKIGNFEYKFLDTGHYMERMLNHGMVFHNS